MTENKEIYKQIAARHQAMTALSFEEKLKILWKMKRQFGKFQEIVRLQIQGMYKTEQ